MIQTKKQNNRAIESKENIKAKEKKKPKISKKEQEELRRQLEEAEMIANSTILSLISPVFEIAFQEDFFTIGLDLTGVYAFADSSYTDEKIQEEKEELMDFLELTEEQVSVCVVDRKSTFNFCSRKLLTKYVGKATKARKQVLDRKTLDEIVKAYDVEIEHLTYYKDYRQTDVFKEIYGIIADADVEPDEALINKICAESVENRKTLIDFGIPESKVYEVIHALRTDSREGIVITTTPIDFSCGVDSIGTNSKLRSDLRYEIGFSIAFLIITAIAALTQFYAVVLMTGFIAVFFAYHSSRQMEVRTFYHFTLVVMAACLLISAYGAKVYGSREIGFIMKIMAKVMG